MAARLVVHMAAHEWGSNLSMQELAREQLELHAEIPDLVVEIVEHAGWYLLYAKISGNVTCVGSANDCAAQSEKLRKFWENLRGAQWEYIPAIWREELPHFDFSDLKTGDLFQFVGGSSPYEYMGNGWYGRPYSGGPWHESGNRKVILLQGPAAAPIRAQFESLLQSA